MHKMFADWYAEAGLPPTAQVLQKRWDAIEKFPIDHDTIVALARFFYDRADSSSLDNFRKAFKDEDPAFLLNGSDHELRVLAGATLINVIETYTENECILGPPSG